MESGCFIEFGTIPTRVISLFIKSAPFTNRNSQITSVLWSQYLNEKAPLNPWTRCCSPASENDAIEFSERFYLKEIHDDYFSSSLNGNVFTANVEMANQHTANALLVQLFGYQAFRNLSFGIKAQYYALNYRHIHVPSIAKYSETSIVSILSAIALTRLKKVPANMNAFKCSPRYICL